MATDPSGREVEQTAAPSFAEVLTASSPVATVRPAAAADLDQGGQFDQCSRFEALAWTDAPVKDGPVGPRHGLLGTRFVGIAATGGVLLAAGVAIGSVAVVAAAMLIGTGPAASTDPLDPVASGRRNSALQPVQRNGAGLPGVAPAASAEQAVAVPPKLTGAFTLWSAAPQRNPCVDHPQVPDIKAGTAVMVSDADGNVLATTRLAKEIGRAHV